MFKKSLIRALGIAAFGAASFAQATVIIDNSTGGFYNNGLGDMASYYGPDQFPGANISEGDPTLSSIAAPTVFGPAFGIDWLNGNYAGGSWSYVANIPDNWAINSETAIVYDFTLASLSDLHIDLGVDNGVYVWLDGNYLFGAMAPYHAVLGEYAIDLSEVLAGNHRLQILREDHGSAADFKIQVDATPSPVDVPEPGMLGLLAFGLFGLAAGRKRQG